MSLDRRTSQSGQRLFVLNLQLVAEAAALLTVDRLDPECEPVDDFVVFVGKKLVHNVDVGFKPRIALMTGPSGAITGPSSRMMRAM